MSWHLFFSVPGDSVIRMAQPELSRRQCVIQLAEVQVSRTIKHYNWMVKFSCGPCCPARCGHCRLPPWRSPQLQFWWHSHMDNQLGECHPKAGRPTDLCFFSIFALLLAVLVVQKRYNICAWNGALCYGYLDSNVSGKFISHYLFDVLVQC